MAYRVKLVGGPLDGKVLAMNRLAPEYRATAIHPEERYGAIRADIYDPARPIRTITHVYRLRIWHPLNRATEPQYVYRDWECDA